MALKPKKATALPLFSKTNENKDSVEDFSTNHVRINNECPGSVITCTEMLAIEMYCEQMKCIVNRAPIYSYRAKRPVVDGKCFTIPLGKTLPAWLYNVDHNLEASCSDSKKWD